jgi:ParB-like chromosome segregation protein Spo0J
MRLIINGGDEPSKSDPALLKAFARARGWFEELASGRVRSMVEIARREGLAKRYVTRLTRLAFVSPVVVEAIGHSLLPDRINLQSLMDGRLPLPKQWRDQEELFTIDQHAAEPQSAVPECEPSPGHYQTPVSAENSKRAVP